MVLYDLANLQHIVNGNYNVDYAKTLAIHIYTMIESFFLQDMSSLTKITLHFVKRYLLGFNSWKIKILYEISLRSYYFLNFLRRHCDLFYIKIPYIVLSLAISVILIRIRPLFQYYILAIFKKKLHLTIKFRKVLLI